MTDGLLVAVITAGFAFLGTVVTGVFAFLSARNSKVAAESVRPNGRGTVTQMIEDTQDQIGALKSQMQAHDRRDDAFEAYVHQRFHDVGNQFTVLRGLNDLREVLPEVEFAGLLDRMRAREAASNSEEHDG